MVIAHYSIAVLSTDAGVSPRLQSLLSEAQWEECRLTWVDLRAAPDLQQLGGYDLYISDGPLLYLVENVDFVVRSPWLWLTTTEVLRQEILPLGVVDCLLWSELTAGLLGHVLRIALRTKQKACPSPLAIANWNDTRDNRLETLIRNVPGTVYRCLKTPQWHGTYFSDAIETLTGFPAANFLPGGDRHFVSLIHPADREFVSQAIDHKLQEKKPFALEYRLKHRDGTIKWVDERGQGVFDDQGNLLWLDGVIVDISEKKAIALELNQRAIQYYEKTPAMLHSMDPTGQIIAVSDRWLQVLGYERQGVIGRNFLDFLTPDSRHLAEQTLLPTLTEQGYIESGNYQFVKQNGEAIEVELSATREPTDHTHRILMVLTDVTVQNQLAQQVQKYQTHLEDLIDQRTQALAASEARLAQAQAIAHIGVWEWDIQANQTYWSPEAFRIYGFEPGEIQPNAEHFFACVHPDDRHQIQDKISRLLAGETIPYAEYRIITPAGEMRYLKDFHEVKYNAQGEAISIGGAVQDITEIKTTLNALAASRTRLAKAQAIAHVGNWEWNLIDNELIWSDEFYRIFDLEPQSITPNFERFIAMVHPDDHNRIEAAIHELKAGDRVYAFEYRIITAQGREKIVLEHVDPLTNSEGIVTCFSGTLQDITTFKKTMNALQESETRFREMVEHIDEAFWVNSPDPREVIYVSPNYAKIWGRSCQSLLDDGTSWLEALHPDHHEQIQRAMVKMQQQGEDFHEEYRVIRPDGDTRWVYARSFQIHDETTGQLLRHVGVMTDITERKEAELKLQAQEARLRTIFDQAALGIMQIDRTEHFSLVNQAFCQICGYTEAELQHLTWRELTHPEDIYICDEALVKLNRREAASVILEKRYRHRQGHDIWAKVICSYIYDDQGQAEYLLTIVEDISEYKQAAIALAESQTRYQEMVEGIPAIIYQYSLQQGGIFYSSQLENILGYDVDFLKAHPSLWNESIHPEDQEKVNEVFRHLCPGKNFSLEYRILDAKGDWRWLYDCSFSIRQIDSDWLIDGFVLDITERKHFDETLRHRLKLETLLADISHLMVVEDNLDFEAVLTLLGDTLAADRMSVMLSQPNTHTVKRLVAWTADPSLRLDDSFTTIDLDPYPWWLDHWQHQRIILLNREIPLPEAASLEQQFLDALGVKAVLWVPIQDQAGKPWGYIECSSTALDHRLWSKEDADILAIAGNLIYNYHHRQQANQQLEIAKELAEAANHAKNQFLTSMSHELRTPLNAVLGFTQIMERSPNLRPEHREYLGIIHRSGKHLLALLNDILNLAKFEKGTLQLNKNLFNLHDLLDDLAQMHALEVQHKSIHIDVSWDEQVPRYINADQPKLHSVLLHLFNNALKFTDTGWVRLVVQTVSQMPLRLRFSVTDTGIGIAEADFTKLFDNFVKLEAGDRLGQGSGLGLALSQKFVNLMGSEIVVSSQPGIGSCFSFELTCDTPTNLRQFTLYPPQAADEPTINLTPDVFKDFSAEWLAAFHQAALAARAQQLKMLIAQLPPEAAAIAKALTALVQKFAFDTLATLSQERTPSDRLQPKGDLNN